MGGLSIHGTALVADSPGGSFCGLPGGVVFTYDISGVMPVLMNQTAPFQGVAAQMLLHSPDASKVYLGLDGATWVTNQNGHSVFANFLVLDASTLAIRSALLVATDGQIASLEGAVTVRSRLYTAGINGIAYVFDTTSDELISSIPLSPGSYFVGLAATDTTVYLTNYQDGKIYSIILGDQAGGDRIGPTIDLGPAAHPSRIAIVTK